MNGNIERETYIGHEAQHMRGVLTLKRPIKNGIICNWDEMEKASTPSLEKLPTFPPRCDVPVTHSDRALLFLFFRFGITRSSSCLCIPRTTPSS